MPPDPATSSAPRPAAPPARRRFVFFRRNRLLLSVVVAPLALLLAYLLLVASDGYRTTARLALRSLQAKAVPSGPLGMLAGLGMNDGQMDAQQLLAWIQSPDLAVRLDRDLDIRAHFQSTRIDPWNRLPADASREDLLRCWDRHLTASFDPLSQTIRIELQTFDADFGRRAVERIIGEAEDFQNRTSQELARRRFAFLKSQLAEAQERLATCRKAMLAFQAEHGIPDPQASGLATSQRLAGLEAELAQARTTLRTLRAYLSQDAAEAQAAQTRVDALATQIAEEKVAAIGQQSGALAPLLARYADLLIAQEFALEAYRTLLSATEQARVDAEQATIAIVPLEHPATAEERSYPRRVYLLGTSAVVLLAAWLLLKLLLITLREHRET